MDARRTGAHADRAAAFYGRAIGLKLDEAPAEVEHVNHRGLVMIDTYHARLPHPASQRGDTLIEVVVSALLLAVIVVGTLTGLNSANRASSQDRARSQADVLAQQEEEQFRSLPILKLSELSVTHEPVVHEVNASGTKYVISSTAKYINDATATSSCNASNPNADYIETSSVVKWTLLGKGKPVVETSIVSPPPDAAIIARVTNAAGEPVPGMTVVSTGPSNLTTTTSTDGCAILAVLPGEYKVDVYKPGYVDENGYPKSEEDPVSNSAFYVAAEETVKVAYEFDNAGTLEVGFQNPSTSETTVGDEFVIANNGMNPAFKAFGTLGTYSTKVSTEAKVFPFTTKYSVYAGTCEADNPHVVNAANPEPPTVSVVGGQVASAIVGVPSVHVQVMSGTGSGSSGSAVVGAAGIITDTGCGTKRSFTTATGGALPHPNLPYGKYNLCLEYSGKKWEHTFENNSTTGPPLEWTGEGASLGASRIYMGNGVPTSVKCT